MAVAEMSLNPTKPLFTSLNTCTRGLVSGPICRYRTGIKTDHHFSVWDE